MEKTMVFSEFDPGRRLVELRRDDGLGRSFGLHRSDRTEGGEASAPAETA
jgi:hypothetical protein